MVKYLSFRNSSFALRYFSNVHKWQGHIGNTPLVIYLESRSKAVLASYLEHTSLVSFLKAERQPTHLIHMLSVNQQNPCGQLGIEFSNLNNLPRWLEFHPGKLSILKPYVFTRYAFA
jgi:hypothetical protein